MSTIQSGGGAPDYEIMRLAEPPTASDGADTYIEKLLTQGGLPPSSENRDKFEKAGVPSAQTHKTTADTILKWAGLFFVGALGVVGLQRLAGGGAKKAAQSVAQKATP